MDLYLPTLRLALEYHGPQHYQALPLFTPLEEGSLRDEERRTALQSANITLIEARVPPH